MTAIGDVERLPATERVQALLAERDRLDGLIVDAVGELDRDDSWQASGASSLVAWLRSTCRLAPGAASSFVTAARRLPHLPTVAAAFQGGQVTYDHVRVITQAANSDARLRSAGEFEAVFVEAAEHLDPSRLRRVVRHWQHAVDDQQALADDNAAHERRSLSLSPLLDGMGAIDGTLDPEGYAVVQTAVAAVMEADWSADDTRTVGQRRHDALVQLARSYLDRGDTPVVRGRRPHLSVVVSLETLLGTPGAPPATLDTGEPICAETARRLACDAAISRVITDGRSLPLDVGRASRSATSAQRRALEVRDKGCVAAGCDRPLAWCDAHHVRHWVRDRGRTDLDNLVLVCKFHHRAVHEGGWTVEWLPDGRPVLRAPP